MSDVHVVYCQKAAQDRLPERTPAARQAASVGWCGCRETDAGLVNVGTVWNVYDKLLQGLMASWRSYLQLPNLKFHVVQVCSNQKPCTRIHPHLFSVSVVS
jgi:hypothetical protein